MEISYTDKQKNKKQPLKGGGLNPLPPPPSGSATGCMVGIDLYYMDGRRLQLCS